MDNFKGKKFGGGGRNFGGDRGGKRSFGSGRGGKKSFGGDRGGKRAEMFSAVCSDCGKNCEVPFRPTGDKPVFCSDCFRNKGDNNSRDFRGGNRGSRDSKPRFENKRSFSGDRGSKDTINYKAQFEMLNAKLDKVISLLNPTATKELNDFVKTTKIKKSVKTPKKEVDTKVLKKAIIKVSAKKSVPKKKLATKKKLTTKKKPATKKVVAKKAVVKKKK